MLYDWLTCFKCYMVNFALIISLRKFPRSRWLFLAVYSLSNGNNVWSGLFFRNSAILHSIDHLTSVVNHIVPAIVTHSIMHLIPQKVQRSKYPAIHDILQSRNSYWSLLMEMMLSGGAFFVAWQSLYYLLILKARQKQIQAGRATSFSALKTMRSHTWLGQFVLSFPAQHQQKAFILAHFMIVVLSIIPVPLLLSPKYSALFTSLVSIVTIDSGARFYSKVAL